MVLEKYVQSYTLRIIPMFIPIILYFMYIEWHNIPRVYSIVCLDISFVISEKQFWNMLQWQPHYMSSTLVRNSQCPCHSLLQPLSSAPQSPPEKRARDVDAWKLIPLQFVTPQRSGVDPVGWTGSSSKVLAWYKLYNIVHTNHSVKWGIDLVHART